MLNTVIFDLDGTLLNTLDDLADAGNRTLVKYGFPTHTTDEYKYFVGNGIPKLVERILPQGSDESLIKEALAVFEEDYAANMKNKTAPYDGTLAMLDRLKEKGLTLCVVTNKQHDMAVSVVREYFGDRIDLICGARDDLPKKPSPEGTFELMVRCHAKKDTTVYIGDSSVDIETARNSGLESIGVLWGFRTQSELLEAGADNIAKPPDDVVRIICEKMN